MTDEAPAVRLRAMVDREQCFGFGFCAGVLPDVFHLDASGHAVALDVDADPALLARAADDCPRSAITLVPRDGRVRAEGG